MSKKRIVFIGIILIFLILLSGCKNNQTSEKISQKTTKELEYFEERIFEIILKFQKNEYLEDGSQNWTKILEDAETINIELDNIMIDLSSLNLANEKISDLSKYTNNILISINNKNEIDLMKALNNLYQTIPKYLNEYEKDKIKISKKELKAFILNSFNYAYNGDWANAKNEVLNAESKYNEMIGNSQYIEENSYNINKVYILIQEYKVTINAENFELSKLKFITLVSEF